MSSKRDRRLRKEARKMVHDALRDKVVSRPKWWFPLYCFWARLRKYPPERVREMARYGIRLEVRR